MRVFAIRRFDKWAKKNDLSVEDILKAVREIESGLVDADLGRKLFKKRIATKGRGKRQSARTLLTYQKNDKSFFLLGFDKGKRENITDDEKADLQKLGLIFLEYTDQQLLKALEKGALIEYKGENHER